MAPVVDNRPKCQKCGEPALVRLEVLVTDLRYSETVSREWLLCGRDIFSAMDHIVRALENQHGDRQ